jgi:SAM-dependent methyltransferase
MSWFESWFDSPYYHILYQHRDETEAKFFLDNLLNELQLPEKASILDLACGKGRHSIYLNSKGYRVTGADLSPESIQAANLHATEDLNFIVQDMREPIKSKLFDAVFNLFTSFGYFDSEAENLKVLEAVRQNLVPEKGVFVLDFMNAAKAVKNLVLSETKELQGIRFEIRRFVENRKIIKEIRFSDKGRDYYFTEMVNAFLLKDFEQMFQRCGLSIEKFYGNYALDAFDVENSDRLILIAKTC